jgi:hypothetical protein
MLAPVTIRLKLTSLYGNPPMALSAAMVVTRDHWITSCLHQLKPSTGALAPADPLTGCDPPPTFRQCWAVTYMTRDERMGASQVHP